MFSEVSYAAVTSFLAILAAPSILALTDRPRLSKAKIEVTRPWREHLINLSSQYSTAKPLDADTYLEPYFFLTQRLLLGRSKRQHYNTDPQHYLSNVLERASEDVLRYLAWKNLIICLDPRLQQEDREIVGRLWDRETQPVLSLRFDPLMPVPVYVLEATALYFKHAPFVHEATLDARLVDRTSFPELHATNPRKIYIPLISHIR